MSEVLWESFDGSAQLRLVSNSRALISQRNPNGEMNVVDLMAADGFLLGTVLRRIYALDDARGSADAEARSGEAT